MAFHDVPCNWQSEAGTVAGRLGGEERFKDGTLKIRRYSRSVIVDVDLAVAGCLDATMDADVSTRWNRVCSVAQ